jgi:hypothetical protein
MQKMKNIIIKIACGILFSITGFAILTISMSYVSESRNDILNFMEPVYNYFLAYSYGLGVVGTILGAIILAGIIGIFFLSGFWVSGKMLFQIHIRKLSRAV